jgi:hypothetical protein
MNRIAAALLLVSAGLSHAQGISPAAASTLGTTPNPPESAGPGNPLGLRAWVFESVDKYSNRAGLGELLRRAGFHVETLPLDRPPYTKGADPDGDADLIAFGSFASSHPAYRDYMTAHADDLDDYGVDHLLPDAAADVPVADGGQRREGPVDGSQISPTI